jgi:endoglucanase
MKKAAIFGLILALLAGVGMILSCNGPEGPEGPVGPVGPTGEGGKDITSPASANWAVSQMRAGWGMGNTYDGSSLNPTSWGNTVVTAEGFKYLKDAGFGVVRIPVSWNYAITSANRPGNTNVFADADYSYAIDPVVFIGNGGNNPGLLNVVQDALDAGLYVILNTHHDTSIFRLWDLNPTNAAGNRTGPRFEQSLMAIEKMWRQIAERFRNYPDKLIFESLNEPRNSGADEWNGGTQEYQRNLNRLHQKFVETVRQTGGNNLTRHLLICTYAASGTDNAQQGLVVPKDDWNQFVNKIIVSLHMYDPYPFALNTDVNNAEGYTTFWAEDGDITAGDGPGYDAGGKPINGPSILKERFKWAHDYFISKGYPVIIGETGAINKNRNNDASLGYNTASRVRWTEYYWKHAYSYGMPVIWWDNGNIYQDRNNPDLGLGVSTGSNGEQGGAIFDRTRLSFPQEQQQIVDAIMRATK